MARAGPKGSVVESVTSHKICYVVWDKFKHSPSTTWETKRTGGSAAPRKTMNKAFPGLWTLPIAPMGTNSPFGRSHGHYLSAPLEDTVIQSTPVLAREHVCLSSAGEDPHSPGWGNPPPLCLHTKQCLLLARCLFLQLQPTKYWGLLVLWVI